MGTGAGPGLQSSVLANCGPGVCGAPKAKCLVGTGMYIHGGQARILGRT